MELFKTSPIDVRYLLTSRDSDISMNLVRNITAQPMSMALVVQGPVWAKMAPLSDTLEFGTVLTTRAPLYRTVILLNPSPAPIVLYKVAVVCDGDDGEMWGLETVDDWRVGKVDNNALGGVQINPGGEYQVTLRLNPAKCKREGEFSGWLMMAVMKLPERTRVWIGKRVMMAVKSVKAEKMESALDTFSFVPSEIKEMWNTPASELIFWPAPPVPQGASLGLERDEEDIEPIGPFGAGRERLQTFVDELMMEAEQGEKDIKELDMSWVKVRITRKNRVVEAVLRVPGAVENRPSLMYGDKVLLRRSRAPDQEIVGYVHHVRGPEITFRLPKGPEEREDIVEFHVRFVYNKNLATERLLAVLDRLAQLPAPPHWFLPVPLPPGLVQRAPRKALAWSNETLNVHQRTVVSDVVFDHGTRGARPYVIFGPPGTGKTVTVVECIVQTLATYPDAKILVSAPSAWAADIVAAGLGAHVVPLRASNESGKPVLLRVNDFRRGPDSAMAAVLPFCLIDTPGTGLFAPATSEQLKEANIIVTTCGSAGQLYASWDKADYPTHIFIDEAGQATEPETYLSLQYASAGTSIVLAGDPRQLGPVIRSPSAQSLGVSFLERIMDQPMYHSLSGTSQVLDGSAVPLMTKLLRSYRCHPVIMEFPSNKFYDGELFSNTAEETQSSLMSWKGDLTKPVMFYGVDGKQERDGDSASYWNEIEAKALAEQVRALVDTTDADSSQIGVIAYFRGQVKKIREILRGMRLGQVRVGTVDDYQGQEARVIFISTTLSRPQSLRRLVDFFGSAKRFNVAVTRAKDLLVVVGNPAVWRADATGWGEYLEHAVKAGAYHGSIMPEVKMGVVSWNTVKGLAPGGALEEDEEAADQLLKEAVSWRYPV